MIFLKKEKKKNNNKKEIKRKERHNNTTEIQGRCPQDVKQPKTKNVRSSEQNELLQYNQKKKKKKIF